MKNYKIFAVFEEVGMCRRSNPLDPRAYERGFAGGGWRPIPGEKGNVGVHVTGSIDVATLYAVNRASTVGPLEDGEPNCGIIIEFDASGLERHPEGDGILMETQHRGIGVSEITEWTDDLDADSIRDAIQGMFDSYAYGEDAVGPEEFNTWWHQAWLQTGGMDLRTLFGWLDGLDDDELEQTVQEAVEQGHFSEEDWAEAISQWRYLVPIGAERVTRFYAVHPVLLEMEEDEDGWRNNPEQLALPIDIEDPDGPSEFDIDAAIPPLVEIWKNPQPFSSSPRLEYHGTDVSRARMSFPRLAWFIRSPWPFGQPEN